MPDRTHRALKRAESAKLMGIEASEVIGFQRRLDESQWFASERLAAYQLHHLKTLVRFAARSVSAYRDLDAGRIEASNTLGEALAAIPSLPRGRLAAAPESFHPADLPAGHTLSGTRNSSGTSGQVVKVETTSIAFGWQNALTFRAQLWAGRDFAKSFAAIRVGKSGAPYPEGIITDSWDAPTAIPLRTGPGYFLSTTASLEEQWEWLGRRQPNYLLTYPSIIRAFAARARREGRGPCKLDGISTVGETVDADLRDDAKRWLGADIFDIYSAEETGTLAIQCPECRRYHTQDEAAIIEVLDAAGRTAEAGTAGRVVVTPLFNYASPLLRYDCGDVAEAGAPCSCGRGLGTLNRIMGRHRNIFRLADGSTFWPSFGAKAFSSFVSVRQHQFRQLSFDHLEVLLAIEAPVTAEAEAGIRATIGKRMRAPMEITFRYVDEIAREPGGKYQEFVCLIA
jgi:phenylacetate-CoA ligase